MSYVFSRPMDSMVSFPSEQWNDGQFDWWGFGEPPQYASQKPAPLGGSKNPQDFWYFLDPWMSEYRSTTNGWPPPDPISDASGYAAWVSSAKTWRPYACWPYNSQVGGYNQPLTNRAQWVKPDWEGEVNWPAVQSIVSVRLDCIINRHRWITGDQADESFRERYAYKIGFYEAPQDYPAEPATWVANRWHGTGTLTVGRASQFNALHVQVTVPAWGGLTKDDVQNRLYGVIQWARTNTPRSNVEITKMWMSVDASLTGSVGPGTGPGVATLSTVG